MEAPLLFREFLDCVLRRSGHSYTIRRLLKTFVMMWRTGGAAKDCGVYSIRNEVTGHCSLTLRYRIGVVPQEEGFGRRPTSIVRAKLNWIEKDSRFEARMQGSPDSGDDSRQRHQIQASLVMRRLAHLRFPPDRSSALLYPRESLNETSMLTLNLSSTPTLA